MARVTLHHLVGRLEAGVGDLGDGQLLVVGLLGRDDRSVGRQWEVDTWVWHQVGLELGQVHVQGSVEAQRGGDGADDLADETVQVGVGRALDVQVAAADVVDGLVVDHEGAVRVLQGGVGRQDRVVRLDHGRGDLRGRVDGELQLGLLAVVDTEALHQQRRESRPGAAAEAVEDEEALEPGALVGQLADTIQDEVDDLLADGVVAAGVVVGRILLAGDELLRVEQLPVCTSTNLVYTRRRTSFIALSPMVKNSVLRP